MLGFILTTEIFYQIPADSAAVHRIFYYPVACVVSGIILSDILNATRKKIYRGMLLGLPVMLIALSIFTQDTPYLRSSWETSHINYLNITSRYLQENTPPDAEIFTFQPPFVIQANRKLSLRMLMEVWQVKPGLTTDECFDKDMVNIEMILDELNQKKPYALLFKNPGRLQDNNGKGRILIPHREAIWEAINSNYYLKHTISMKENVDGVINIYFRKDS